MNPRPLAYSGVAIDRATNLRGDDAAIARRLRAPDARFLLLSDDRNYVTHAALQTGSSIALALDTGTRDAFITSAEVPLFLGLDGALAIFALDISSFPLQTIRGLLPPGDFTNVREVATRLSPIELARAGYARALAYWNRTHRFCPTCGSATLAARGGHVRACPNPACEREHYPHINPAVIMLVSTVDEAGVARALLGRHSGLPPGTYSTLAGFVEPGETLEEAVAREVFEEAGVHVTDARYFRSQPWPFPAGLMLGFHARATSVDISRNDAELDDARWFSARDIARFGEWGDTSEGFKVPRRDSIARALIEDWLARVGARASPEVLG